MDILRISNKGVQNQAQGAYEICGVLLVADMMKEIYIGINIELIYQYLKPYSNIYHHKRYVSKFISTYSKDISTRYT